MYSPEILIHLFYFIMLLVLFFLKETKKYSFDFDTYLAILNAIVCVLIMFILVVDAVNYIPEPYSHYISSLKGYENVSLYYHSLEKGKEVLRLFTLLFLIKKCRRSWILSIAFATFSLPFQFSEAIALIFTGNYNNPLFYRYYENEGIIDFFKAIIFFTFIVNIITINFYFLYQKKSQIINYQIVTKIIFIVLSIFLVFWLPIFTRIF